MEMPIIQVHSITLLLVSLQSKMVCMQKNILKIREMSTDKEMANFFLGQLVGLTDRTLDITAYKLLQTWQASTYLLACNEQNTLKRKMYVHKFIIVWLTYFYWWRAKDRLRRGRRGSWHYCYIGGLLICMVCGGQLNEEISLFYFLWTPHMLFLFYSKHFTFFLVGDMGCNIIKAVFPDYLNGVFISQIKIDS